MTQEGREDFLQSIQPVVDASTSELIARILAVEGSGDHTLRQELGDRQYLHLIERICGLAYHGKTWEPPLHLTLQNPSEKQDT